MCYNIIAMRGHDKKAALAELSKLYPDARPALHYGSAYELLVAVILSAQCTDERVNKVTEKLFEKYNNPAAMTELSQEQLERYIFSCGLYKTKAEHILSASRDILERFGGNVPDNIKDLMSLAGVGRKTANVVYSVAFGGDAIAVDTHVFRVSNRLGLAGERPRRWWRTDCIRPFLKSRLVEGAIIGSSITAEEFVTLKNPTASIVLWRAIAIISIPRKRHEASLLRIKPPCFSHTAIKRQGGFLWKSKKMTARKRVFSSPRWQERKNSPRKRQEYIPDSSRTPFWLRIWKRSLPDTNRERPCSINWRGEKNEKQQTRNYAQRMRQHKRYALSRKIAHAGILYGGFLREEERGTNLSHRFSCLRCRGYFFPSRPARFEARRKIKNEKIKKKRRNLLFLR